MWRMSLKIEQRDEGRGGGERHEILNFIQLAFEYKDTESSLVLRVILTE